jgi:hypothetical protein
MHIFVKIQGNNMHIFVKIQGNDDRQLHGNELMFNV